MAPFEPLKSLLRRMFCSRKPRLPLENTSTPISATVLAPFPAPILQLPADVLCYIVDRIPPTEAASLALSSKAILNTVGRRVLRIEKTEDRVELLKHLEIFFPGHLLCYQCGKFHVRRKKFRIYYDEETSCDRKNGRYSYCSYVLDSPFTRFQEIMNRHRYGEEHGASVKSLNRVKFWNVGPFDQKFELTKAKIIDDQLFIRTDIRLLSNKKGRWELKKLYYCQFCPHHGSWEFRVGESHHRAMTFIRCLECSTEICFDIVLNPFSYGRFRTIVWCNLGLCRSPFENEWRALTSSTGNYSSCQISRNEARYAHLF